MIFGFSKVSCPFQLAKLLFSGTYWCSCVWFGLVLDRETFALQRLVRLLHAVYLSLKAAEYWLSGFKAVDLDGTDESETA